MLHTTGLNNRAAFLQEAWRKQWKISHQWSPPEHAELQTPWSLDPQAAHPAAVVDFGTLHPLLAGKDALPPVGKDTWHLDCQAGSSWCRADELTRIGPWRCIRTPDEQLSWRQLAHPAMPTLLQSSSQGAITKGSEATLLSSSSQGRLPKFRERNVSSRVVATKGKEASARKLGNLDSCASRLGFNVRRTDRYCRRELQHFPQAGN
eukprot:TRINITY_DN89402_c0_g1_i1.p1 TRINITY_DN89402_c0_g1~~TRINITY_DN89402_c0_g1_i1.p1  ORF type:complete len:206 (-),score=32.64 TRINITY_DN89402_c0_g1_i1:583-1200(-)